MTEMAGVIVTAFDGSKYANQALHVAVDLAKTYNAELVVLNVQPNLNTRNVRKFFSDKEIDEYEKETGLKILEKTKDFLQSTGVAYRYMVGTGSPQDEICKFADEASARFIVMGSRGMNPVMEKILGSVSSGVIHRAKRPVVIAPAQTV